MYKRHNQFNLPVPAGRSGYTGRVCPKCEKYFKLVFGTGLPDIEDCYCPYCGFHEHHSHFHTKSQIDFATSVAVNAITREFDDSLRQVARNINTFNRRSKGLINLTMQVNSTPTPVRVPEDLKLETYIECTHCTLKYAVYGVYAFCPDCARHNAVQILEKNLEISGKLLEITFDKDNELAERLISKSLSDVVSAIDGFGREICRANASKSSEPLEAEKIRFQNLQGAQSNVHRYFGFDIASELAESDWETAVQCFQKRHVLEHKSGVVDAEYKRRANDPRAIVGRKVRLSRNEVRRLINVVHALGAHIFAQMENLP